MTPEVGPLILAHLGAPRACQTFYKHTHGGGRILITDSGALQLSRKHKDGAVENYNSKLTRSEIVLCQKSSALAGGRGGKLCKKPTHTVENIDDMRHAGKAEVVEQLFTSVKFARQETLS